MTGSMRCTCPDPLRLVNSACPTHGHDAVLGTNGDRRMMSAEQRARDLLESYGLADAQSMSSGDLVELANFIADARAYRASRYPGPHGEHTHTTDQCAQGQSVDPDHQHR